MTSMRLRSTGLSSAAYVSPSSSRDSAGGTAYPYTATRTAFHTRAQGVWTAAPAMGGLPPGSPRRGRGGCALPGATTCRATALTTQSVTHWPTGIARRSRGRSWWRRACSRARFLARRGAVLPAAGWCLQPAALLEDGDRPDEDDDHHDDDGPEAEDRLLAGYVRVHAEDAGDERERQHDDADRGEHPEGVVQPVADDRLGGGLERLDDLFEVLEHVPDALGGVVDVVEIDLEVLGDVAARGLEILQRRALRPDDLAEVDDLLLDVGEVAHDLRRRVALEDVLLQALELVAHLAQHRERGVHGVVDDLVEQVARALAEQPVADVLARAAALEQVLERLDRLVGQRDHEVGPDEDVELGRVQAPDALVEGREVQHDEQVVVVLVDLRALIAAEDVLVVEVVEVEVLLEPRAVGERGALDVDPAQRRRAFDGRLDDLDVGTLGLSGERVRATRPRRSSQPGLGQVRHGDFEARLRSRRSASDSLRLPVYLPDPAPPPQRDARVDDDIAGHIQRSGGTGPMKLRQPPATAGTVPIPERCGRGFPR